MGRVSSGYAECRVKTIDGQQRHLRDNKRGKTNFWGKTGLVYLIYHYYHKLRLVYSEHWAWGSD